MLTAATIAAIAPIIAAPAEIQTIKYKPQRLDIQCPGVETLFNKKMEKNKDFWNKNFAAGRDYTIVNLIWLKELEKSIGKSRLKNKTWLDIGAGTGDFAVKLAGKKWQVEALDFSKIALNKARQRARSAGYSKIVKFTEADLEDKNWTKSLSGKKFDAVSAKLVLVFIKNKERLLENIKSILKPEGVFILITPVLFPKFFYEKKSKNISVDLRKTCDLLNKHFSKTEIFHKNHFGENGCEITFISRV